MSGNVYVTGRFGNNAFRILTCEDNDGDGFGLPGSGLCSGGSADDCDDADDTIFPGALEVPDDDIDQDCNGFDTVTCFADNDGDGFGDGTVLADDGDCLDPGESDISGDCDDSDPSSFPGAVELCDGRDNDCNNIVDDNGDSDLDGVFDCNDQCPGADDTVDSNDNGVPDCLEAPPTVPTVSQWGLVILALLLMTAYKTSLIGRKAALPS